MRPAMSKKNSPATNDNNRGQAIGSKSDPIAHTIRTTFRKDTPSLKGEKNGYANQKKK
jgi:hypothetical protein